MENGSGKILLESSADPFSWDSWSVRDTAMLTNPDASFATEGSRITMYYTGCSNQMELQQTGRAYSYDCGRSWGKDPNNPILRVSPGAWDSKVSSSPWVLKSDNGYMMYYRGSSAPCKNDAIGLATSTDGVSFHKHPRNPIIQSSQFNGILKNPTAMGVLNAIHSHEGIVMVFFEALESDYDQKGQIFGAQSDDGINFIPLNQGSPIFSSRNVSSWPVRGVCNPRVFPLREKGYLLGFNGTYDGEYSIGFAYTENLKDWEEMETNPIIVPRGFPIEDTSSHRIEGPVIDARELREENNKIECYFMSIPGGSIMQKNSVINSVRLKDSRESGISFASNTKERHSIIHGDKSLKIDSLAEESGYAQASIICKKNIKRLSLEVQLEKFTEKSQFNIQISNSLNPFPNSYGLMLKWIDNKIYLKKDTGRRIEPLAFDPQMWNLLKTFGHTPVGVRLSLSFKDSLSISIDRAPAAIFKSNEIKFYEARITTFSCLKANISIDVISLD